MDLAFQISLVVFSITPVLLVLTVPALNAVRHGTMPDIFSPPWIMAGALLIGTTIRTIVLLFDPEVERKSFQVLGPFTPEEALPLGLIAVNLGVLAWWAGYHSGLVLRWRKKEKKQVEFNQRRYLRVHRILLLFSLILMALYLQTIGFFSSLSTFGFSAKRMFTVGDIAGNTTTFGYFRMASDFLAVTAIYYFAFKYNFVKPTLKQQLVSFVLFLLACIIPFVASARGEIIYLAFSILIVRHYMKKIITLKKVLIYIFISFIILGYLGTLRQQAYSRISNQDREISYSLADSFHTLAYNAHFLGVGKTAVVVSQVPKKHGYRWGTTYLTLFFAPIPRTLWPNKPIVRIGRFVGVELFERGTFSGVPPGMIGEAYLNFSWFGVIAIPFLFGVFCKSIYRSLVINRDPNDFAKAALYGILWVFMLDVLVTDFTGNIMRLLRYLLPFYLLYAASFVRSPNTLSEVPAKAPVVP